MNTANIIGRLTKDPEVKKLNDGLTVCELRMAVDDTFSKDDRADFINVTVYGNQGDLCERYLRKGFMAGVTGRIRCDVYTSADGVKRYPVKLVADHVQFLQWPERKGSQETVASVQETAAV